MDPRKTLLAACLLTLALAACGGGGGEPPPVPGPDTTWTAVESAVTASVQANSIPGLTLSVYDRTGRQVYVHTWGDAAPSRRIAIASASKLVSGFVLLRLVDQGLLTLDSTTGTVLGWTGPQAAITLRQLLSFTSGLQPGQTFAGAIRVIPTLAGKLHAPPSSVEAAGQAFVVPPVIWEIR